MQCKKCNKEFFVLDNDNLCGFCNGDIVLAYKPKEDKIKPSYYHKGKVDTITFCLENKLGFCEGNIVKYIVRYADKNGMEDLLKVREYLNRIIGSEESK